MRLAIGILLLAGCAASPQKVVVVHVPAPYAVETVHMIYQRAHPLAAAKTCLGAPAPPNNENNHNMGAYIAALIEAGDDCRSKLESP